MDAGSVAPLYLFYNGPYSNAFCSGRFSFYGVTGTPTVKMDGFTVSSTPSSYPGSVNNRLAVPSHVDFDINIVGNASGGIGYYSITAEQDLGVSGQIKVWSVIIQDDFIASGAGWGGYSGMEMRWMPVAWPLGTQGQVVTFSGPYPQTVHLMGNYTLDPSQHIFDNLNVVTFVQLGTGTREVLNANYMDLPDTAAGIYEDHTLPVGGSAFLHVGPNPSSGTFSVTSVVPDGQTGTVSVFDLSGRTVQSFSGGGVSNAVIEETGLYFVRLVTSGGVVVNRQIAVVR